MTNAEARLNTNAEARFNNSLRPRKPEGSLGRTAQDVHLDSHTAPELWSFDFMGSPWYNRTGWRDVKHQATYLFDLMALRS